MFVTGVGVCMGVGVHVGVKGECVGVEGEHVGVEGEHMGVECMHVSVVGKGKDVHMGHESGVKVRNRQ
jgi:hypothetical protein